MDVAGVVTDLLAEARSVGERRLLVLAGDRDRGYGALASALDATDLARERTTLVGPDDRLACEYRTPDRADRLLGTTRDCVALDCHDGLRPNHLGSVVGAVDGGGLLALLTPPLEEWPDRRGTFDETLAVPPFAVADVAGNFRRRLVGTLRDHPGVAIVDVDRETVVDDGLTDPPPRIESDPPAPPADPTLSRAVYAACLTGDQVTAVDALGALGEPGMAVVVEADRGRGKSAAAGIAAGALAADGADVLVTAPSRRACGEVFVRAAAVLADGDALAHGDPPAPDANDPPERVEAAGGGVVRYEPPTAAAELPGDPGAVVVDEAAALPVRLLERFLDAPSVGFTTTVHGYEGAGRGFSVRFRDRLADAAHDVREVAMTEPIRYAAGDPVEVWSFRALLLDAGPAADQLVADAVPETAAYRALDSGGLLADEHRLREAFGLLVLAHYRTEPDDLARLLDAPNVAVRALLHDGHVVSVALLAREGGLDEDTRAAMYGGARVAGNMLPDVLTSQLRDEGAGEALGWRVMRIATHPAVRERGLGSRLLADVREEFADADWLGTGFGATPGLVSFWAANGYRAVHLSTGRNDASGEHSVLMLDPLSTAGEALAERHGAWFRERVRDQLSDPLAGVDPDVVRAVLGATAGTTAPDLSPADARVLADAAFGPGLYSTSPGPFRDVAVAALSDPGMNLDGRAERLLVLKALQARPWDEVVERLGYPSRRQAMRALGDACRPLAERYAPEAASRARERFGEDDC
jgi:tRNA(Met) cytidine acetyltransferase